MTAANLNILGLIANLVGVVLLFRYGMPYRVPYRGSFILREDDDADEPKRDAVYKRLGYLGLLLIIVGTGLQIAGAIR